MKNDTKQTINDAKSKQIKRRKKAPRGKSFENGHKHGVRFGEGQPTNLGGRPKGGEAILRELKEAYETYGLSANKLAQRIVKTALDEEIEPRYAFPFIKEANNRIYGQPTSSLEEILNKIIELQENQSKELDGLSLKVKELAALNDVKGVLAQLDAEGQLEPMLKEIRKRGS
jgi:hypothetical protein